VEGVACVKDRLTLPRQVCEDVDAQLLKGRGAGGRGLVLGVAGAGRGRDRHVVVVQAWAAACCAVLHVWHMLLP
jgi:hypothetical protein